MQSHDVYTYEVVSSRKLYRLGGSLPALEGHAEIALSAGIPVVTADCQYDNPLLRHTTVVAAINGTGFPGVSISPTGDEVLDFIDAEKSL